MTTESAPAAVDLLMQGGGVSAQFPKIGHSYTGTIMAIGQARKQTDPKDNSVKTFADGSPRYQVPITLATDARGKFTEDGDPEEVPDDDGVRVLWVRADMQRAIRDAVLKARKDHGLSPAELPGPEVGGLLTVTRGKNFPKKQAGMKPQYSYTAEYVPASKNAAASALMDDHDPFADDE
jgi:hypothetical protein